MRPGSGHPCIFRVSGGRTRQRQFEFSPFRAVAHLQGTAVQKKAASAPLTQRVTPRVGSYTRLHTRTQNAPAPTVTHMRTGLRSSGQSDVTSDGACLEDWIDRRVLRGSVYHGRPSMVRWHSKGRFPKPDDGPGRLVAARLCSQEAFFCPRSPPDSKPLISSCHHGCWLVLPAREGCGTGVWTVI